jgi:hypothetical protein
MRGGVQILRKEKRRPKERDGALQSVVFWFKRVLLLKAEGMKYSLQNVNRLDSDINFAKLLFCLAKALHFASMAAGDPCCHRSSMAI